MHRRAVNLLDPSPPQQPDDMRELKRRRRKRVRMGSTSYDWELIVQATFVFLGTFGCVLIFLWGLSSLWKSTPTQPTSPTKPKGESKPNNRNRIGPNGVDSLEEMQTLAWNKVYRVPDSIPIVGDRSNEYVRLRQDVDGKVDQQLPQLLRDLEAKQKHSYVPRPMEMSNSDQISYDIYNCPDVPPEGYPFAWRTVDIITAWPTDDVEPPLNENGDGLVYQSFCVFDYQKDFEKATTYRDAHLPFIVVNDPAVLKTAARWSMPSYMDRLLGSVPRRTEYSENNHFMYFVPQGKGSHRHGNPEVPKDWKAPTQMMRMDYGEWLHKAQTPRHGRNDPHWYFRLIGCGVMGNDGTCDRGSTEALFDELPFFQPKKNLYIYEPTEQKGIHCRFGMPGVIAENHFDGSRNSIALLAGSRRYILSHPDQCNNLALLPKGHPSARHSAVDWSNPDLKTYPQFQDARSNEVVLQPGQVMYLPTVWFHYIVSLEINMQCNTRSGIEKEMMHYVHDCGF